MRIETMLYAILGPELTDDFVKSVKNSKISSEDLIEIAENLDHLSMKKNAADAPVMLISMASAIWALTQRLFDEEDIEADRYPALTTISDFAFKYLGDEIVNALQRFGVDPNHEMYNAWVYGVMTWGSPRYLLNGSGNDHDDALDPIRVHFQVWHLVESWHAMFKDSEFGVRHFVDLIEEGRGKWVHAYGYNIEFNGKEIFELSEQLHENCLRINTELEGKDWEYPHKFEKRSISPGDIVIAESEVGRDISEIRSWAVLTSEDPYSYELSRLPKTLLNDGIEDYQIREASIHRGFLSEEKVKLRFR